jgi:hypothetical protein
VAGVVGPLLMNFMRQLQLARGIAPSQAYNQTMYVLAGLLVLGFVANLLVRPVGKGHLQQAAQPSARPLPQGATPRTT